MRIAHHVAGVRTFLSGYHSLAAISIARIDRLAPNLINTIT